MSAKPLVLRCAIALILLVPSLSHAQVFDWALQNNSNYESGHYMLAQPMMDRHHNLVTIFHGTDSVRIGDSTFRHAGWHAYLAAIDTDKVFRWAYDVTSFYQLSPRATVVSMCIDSSDAIYLSVNFTDSVATYGSYVLHGRNGELNRGLLKLVQGVVQWAVLMPGTVPSFSLYGLWNWNVTSIECSPSGEVYTEAHALDSMRIGTTGIRGVGKRLSVLLHYNSSGSLHGYRTVCIADTLLYGAARDSWYSTFSLTVVRTGGCAIVISLVDSVALDPNFSLSPIHAKTTLLRYSSSDTMVWYRLYDSLQDYDNYTDNAYKGVTSDRFGNLIVCPGVLPERPPRMFDGLPVGGRTGGVVEKLDTLGHALWICVGPILIAWGSPRYDYYYGAATGIHTDVQGNIFIHSLHDSSYARLYHVLMHQYGWSWTRITSAGFLDWTFSDDALYYGGFLPIDRRSSYMAVSLSASLPMRGDSLPPNTYYYLHGREIDFITTQTDSVCPGATFPLPYTTSPGLYPGDTLTVEVSDTTGDFSNALIIGRGLWLSHDTTILCHIPDTMSIGTYQVRVYSYRPAMVARSATLIVRDRPKVTIAHPKGLSFCKGSELELVAKGANYYLWSTGDTSSVIYVDTPGVYKLAGRDTNGCDNIDSVVVIENPLPHVTIQAAGKLAFCEGDSVCLVAYGAKTFLWSTHSTLRFITVRTSGTYWVVGTDTNYCDGVDSVEVTVYPNPEKPTITRDGDELVSSSDTNNQWYYKGLKIQAGRGKRFPLSAEGAYSVSVTNEHGCSTLSDPYDYKKTSSGIAPFESGLSVRVTDHMCSINTGAPMTLSIEILDILGRLVTPVMNGTIASDISLPIPLLPAGTYFIRAETSSQIVTVKFIEP